MKGHVKMITKRVTRRNFIKGSLAAGAALSLPGYRVLGANGDVRVAIIGCGGKGTAHVGDFSKLPGVRLVAVSDADLTHMDSAVKKAGDNASRITKHQDFRRILDDKDVDAVVFASPNHWHSLMTVMACRAGKDVYVEKPISHCLWEGRKSVEAARKYNRIVQAGTQQRSDPALIEAAADIKAGVLGKVQWIHSMWYRYRQPIGKVNAPTPIPDYVDYDLWCGPGPKGPLMRENLHYDWHWIWAYGNGDMGNIAPHLSDDMRHLLDMKGVPKRVMSVGKRFAWDDDGQTPNTMFTLYDYDIPLVLEIRDLPYDENNKSRRGESVYHRFGQNFKFTNIVKCEEGFLAVTRGGGKSYDNDGKEIKQYKGDGGRGHAQNFIDAVRSRKYTDLNADILKGHYCAVMIHQANISYKVGAESSVDKIRERVKGTEEAMETLNQMVAHVRDNGVDLERDKPVLGPWLNYDNDSERFTGELAEEANKHLKGYYRYPFILDEKV